MIPTTIEDGVPCPTHCLPVSTTLGAWVPEPAETSVHRRNFLSWERSLRARFFMLPLCTVRLRRTPCMCLMSRSTPTDPTPKTVPSETQRLSTQLYSPTQTSNSIVFLDSRKLEVLIDPSSFADDACHVPSPSVALRAVRPVRTNGPSAIQIPR